MSRIQNSSVMIKDLLDSMGEEDPSIETMKEFIRIVDENTETSMRGVSLGSLRIDDRISLDIRDAGSGWNKDITDPTSYTDLRSENTLPLLWYQHRVGSDGIKRHSLNITTLNRIRDNVIVKNDYGIMKVATHRNRMFIVPLRCDIVDRSQLLDGTESEYSSDMLLENMNKALSKIVKLHNGKLIKDDRSVFDTMRKDALDVFMRPSYNISMNDARRIFKSMTEQHERNLDIGRYRIPEDFTITYKHTSPHWIEDLCIPQTDEELKSHEMKLELMVDIRRGFRARVQLTSDDHSFIRVYRITRFSTAKREIDLNPTLNMRSFRRPRGDHLKVFDDKMTEKFIRGVDYASINEKYGRVY